VETKKEEVKKEEVKKEEEVVPNPDFLSQLLNMGFN
jgi:hypothetical protein